MRRYLIMLMAAVVAAGLAGCAKHTLPAAPQEELTDAQRNFEALWQASREVLRRYDFPLDRQDRRDGVITTLPLTGKQFFEFWRHDAVGSADEAESTVQTLYKRATVRIRRSSDEADTYQAEVIVQVYRSDRPQPQVTSTSEAYSLFRLPGDDGARNMLLDKGRDELGRETDESEWIVPLGRDRNLETIMAMKIDSAAAKHHAKLP